MQKKFKASKCNVLLKDIQNNNFWNDFTLLNKLVYLFYIYTITFWRMFLKSVEEVNSLISAWMPNNYLSSSYWEIRTFSMLRFFYFKNFDPSSNFVELQIIQLLLNFKNYCWNLKTKELVAKVCVAFLLY